MTSIRIDSMELALDAGWVRARHGVTAPKTDQEWSAALEAALTISRRDDLDHGTNVAYVHGCVCKECREHQRIRSRTRCD
jgi:hypothetical protein